MSKYLLFLVIIFSECDLNNSSKANIGKFKNKDETKVILEESDFSPGGFIFKDAKGENKGNWDIKLELVSYKDAPEVKLTLNKSPISKNAFETSKKCSITK